MNIYIKNNVLTYAINILIFIPTLSKNNVLSFIFLEKEVYITYLRPMKVTVWCSSQELTLVPAIVTWQKGVCTPHVDRVCLAGPCSPTWKGRFRDVTSTLTQLVISTRFLLDIIIGH